MTDKCKGIEIAQLVGCGLRLPVLPVSFDVTPLASAWANNSITISQYINITRYNKLTAFTYILKLGIQ